MRPVLASRAMRCAVPFGEPRSRRSGARLRRALPQRRLEPVPALLDRVRRGDRGRPSAGPGGRRRLPRRGRRCSSAALPRSWSGRARRSPGRSSRAGRGTTRTAGSSTSRSRRSARCSAASPPRRLATRCRSVARRAVRVGARREGDPRALLRLRPARASALSRSVTGTSSRCSRPRRCRSGSGSAARGTIAGACWRCAAAVRARSSSRCSRTRAWGSC